MTASPTTTEIEAAITVLDDGSSGLSISSNEEAATSIPLAATEMTYVQFWQGRVHRSIAVFADVNTDPRITTNFSTADKALNFGQPLEHATAAIHAKLAKGYICQFKIGITYIPRHRFTNGLNGYAPLGPLHGIAKYARGCGFYRKS